MREPVFPKNFFWGAAHSSKMSEAPAGSEARSKERRPEKFFFGAATSAHQVEGGNLNDWTEWERESSKLKVKSAKLRKWPEYILKNYPNPLQEENYISGASCDHYNRFREDFDIAKSLGHNAHRFSIEWSRIEPEEGKFNKKEIEHYREVIQALRDRGMEPFVTLWHWTAPLWFAARGGWEADDALRIFGRFCDKIGRAFADDVTCWIPLNEPALWSNMAYHSGIFPPCKRSIFRAVRVYRILMAAHREAYRALKSVRPTFQVGTSENMTWIGNPFLRPVVNYFRNFYFLRKAADEIDFIGINYYRKMYGKPAPDTSDRGWEIYPEGLYRELLLLKKFNKPIYVTENGIDDCRDILRGKFIKDHVGMITKAAAEGADVRGYFYWSLLDNFEWEEGFWPRLGLAEVNYKTMERKIRQSALEYKKMIGQFSSN